MARPGTIERHPNDDLLLGLKDGVLFSGDRSLVDSHLTQCPQCQARLTALTEYVSSRPSAPVRKPTPVARAVAGRAIAVLLLFGLVGGGGVMSRRELTRRAATPVELAPLPQRTAVRSLPAPIVALNAPEEPVASAAAPDASVAVSKSSAATAAPAAPPATAPAPAVAIVPTVDAMVVASPDRNVRWRVLGRSVERTANGGTEWVKQSIELSVNPTAGVAPSAEICWLVGKGGQVWVATGAAWKAVPLGQPFDLLKVAAVDATTAIVTAADGREYATTNGGARWALLPR